MKDNYKSRYSGEEVDAAVEYYLRHSQIVQDNSYSYTRIIFCESTDNPSSPFNNLPIAMPRIFPITGTDNKLWYEYPNTSSRLWWQCILVINKATNKIINQGEVIPMSGEKGETGSLGNAGLNGTNGTNGTDGIDGINGNYTEYRYQRNNSWALILTPAQKSSRIPVGWQTDPSTTGVFSSLEILTQACSDSFDLFIHNITGNGTIPLTDWMELGFTSYKDIDDWYYNERGVRINALNPQYVLLVYTDFYDLHSSTWISLAQRTDAYHRLKTKYLDPDHQWNLFMIQAIINGNNNTLIGEWSDPIRLTGENGSMGPEGNPGVSGVPGVSIGCAFTIGNETSYRGVNPLVKPYSTNYITLLQNGTGWYNTTDNCNTTDEYPYIWFTLCRYIDDNGTITMETPWSKPSRYTGLNGITTTIQVKLPVIYPLGIYDANETYTNDGNTAPYVYFSGSYLYLALQTTWKGIVNDPAGRGIGYYSTSSLPDETHPWVRFEHFNSLFAKVGIIANGLIGSAVFNGNYMFSLRGIHRSPNGTEFDTLGITTPAYNPSASYQNFMKDYETGLPVSINSPRNAFIPHFWINFSTGEFGSVSMNSSIDNAMSSVWLHTIESLQSYYTKALTESKIELSADNISMRVSLNVNNELLTAGIDITSGRVKIIGDLQGTMNGSFNGDISANSLTVIGSNGYPALKFGTYDSSTMGTPINGTLPADGTPVILVYHNNKEYILNMTELSMAGSGANYILVPAVTKDLRCTSNLRPTLDTLGTPQYQCIIEPPCLAVTDSLGKPTAIRKEASLFLGSIRFPWDRFFNRYYSYLYNIDGSNPILEMITDPTDPLCTNIPLGKLSYRVKTTPVTVSNNSYITNIIYPVTVAVYLDYSDKFNKQIYCITLGYGFRKLSITEGLIDNTAPMAIITRGFLMNSSGLIRTNNYVFLKKRTSSTSACLYSNYTNNGNPRTSTYFLELSTIVLDIDKDFLTLNEILTY